MSALIKILGKESYQFDPVAGTFTLTADEVANLGTTASGKVRLELWFSTDPWDPAGPNNGYKVAVDPIGARPARSTRENRSRTCPQRSL